MAKNLNIIQINDTHANLYEHGDVIYTENGIKVETMGGYPRIMTKIKEYKAKFPDEDILILDNGDTIHGRVEAVESKGQVMIPYLQKLGIDAMTFHWDSAYTPSYLKSFQEKLGYPILANNVYHEGSKDHFFEPSIILEKNGLKIGIIGIASNIIQSNMPHNFWEGADFVDGIVETQTEVDKLRSQSVDLVIVLSHLGYPQDIELLKQVDGIDLCLSGHTHNRVEEAQRINGSYIIQSGSLASSMGYLRLQVGQGIEAIEHDFIPLDASVEMDKEMLAMFDKDEILLEYKEKLKELVGESKLDLHRASNFYGSMDFFLNDAIREVSSCPISFSNGWRWGGAIPKGELTLEDLYTIVPMNPPIMTAKLTGRELFDLLEDNIENTFSCEVFQQKGGYLKRNSGLKIYFKLENPYGQRIQKIFVNEEELDLEKMYEVAYITVQAVPKHVGRDHRTTNIKAIEAMQKLLQKGPYDRKDLESYIPI